MTYRCNDYGQIMMDVSGLIVGKRCRRCRKEKLLSEFSIHKMNRTDGRRGQCRHCTVETERDYHRKNPRARLYRVVKSRYGISPEEYETLGTTGVCQICGTVAGASGRRRLCIDHDHETGVIRGVLCTPCNLAIGYLRDDPALLRKAIAYLGSDDISQR